MKDKRIYSWKRQGIKITPAGYRRLFKLQGGVCKLCSKPPKPGRNLDVDHDHKTGKVRGLLCRHCNRQLRVCRWVTHGWLDRARAYCSLPPRLD